MGLAARGRRHAKTCSLQTIHISALFIGTCVHGAQGRREGGKIKRQVGQEGHRLIDLKYHTLK